MKTKKIIDGIKFLETNNKGDKYLDIDPEFYESLRTMEIKCVKLIGKIKGIKENVELVMDDKIFFDWIRKLKNEKTKTT